MTLTWAVNLASFFDAALFPDLAAFKEEPA